MHISDRFEEFNNEHLKFEKVENKKSMRPDIHAFLLLDSLFPGTENMVDGATHDQIWLSLKMEQIETLTDEHIVELLRCGVLFDSEIECLYSFV